jgi:exopolysaccharide/PEP-CTERM locus tyrosine autokinase
MGEDAEITAQEFRRIKRPIIRTAFETDLPAGENANVIMMASAMPGAGKSFCAYNLSQSISMEREIGAVLVDADVLKPGISRSMGLHNNVGLIDYLLDPTMELADILVSTGLNDILVIPAGHKHPHATELLASRRMQDLVRLLSIQFANRVVIFDAPPLLLTNEAQVLASRMGQIVLVIEARVSSQDSVMRALSMLDRNKPINAILNKSRSASDDGYRGDYYGYYHYPHRSGSHEMDS